MRTSLFTLYSLLLLCLSSLADDVWSTNPTPVPVAKADVMKFLTTQTYFWLAGLSDPLVVDAVDSGYTLRTATDFSCATNFQTHIHQMQAVKLGETELLLAANKNGHLYTFPLHPTDPLSCPQGQQVHDGSYRSASLDTDRELALFTSSVYTDTNKLQLQNTVLRLHADGNHTILTPVTTQEYTFEFKFYENLPRSMTTLVSLGTDGRSVVVFLPNGFNGITTYHGSIDGTLTETNISTDTPLAAAVGCFRMTRIGVSDPLSTTTTVTLAVACADDGAGKPAVYVVQVPVVEGVPQTLKVTASVQMKKMEERWTFSTNGNLQYLSGSLVLSTQVYIYNFILTDPLSPSPTITLRSWFKSGTVSLKFNGTALVTPDVLALAPSGSFQNGPAVLDLLHGTVMQGATNSGSSSGISGYLYGDFIDVYSVLGLSDTSFITAGGNGAIRRWESCAGLGYDYTAAVLNTSDPSAPSATCGCPAGRACLLGTANIICPTNTTKIGAQCLPKAGWYPDRATLSVMTCPAGHKCVDGVKSLCEGNTYQPSAGQTECYTCPGNSTASTDHTTCAVEDGYYISGGTLATNDATTDICPEGHKCVAGEKTECTGAEYQPSVGKPTCLTVHDSHYSIPEGTSHRTGQTECPAGSRCLLGIKIECINDSTNREYQPAPGQTKCLPCSDTNSHEHLDNPTSTTCDYCPGTEYHSSTGCQPCNALTGANYCETKTDAHDIIFAALGSCRPDQWRVNPYQCRFCQSDEICHGDGRYTWKFKWTLDTDTISGKIVIAVIVVASVAVVCALAGGLAYYLRRRSLLQGKSKTNAETSVVVVGATEVV